MEKVKYWTKVFLAGIVAVISLMTLMMCFIGIGAGIGAVISLMMSFYDNDSLPSTSESQAPSTVGITLPEITSDCNIEFLGVDPSIDMVSYLTERYPEMLNYTEVCEDSLSESKTARFCFEVYLSRREELLEKGSNNMAYGTADGQFTFAANFGEKGNFAVTFDVSDVPRETAERFDSSLDKLLEVLKERAAD